jgi:hypothetical protein
LCLAVDCPDLLNYEYIEGSTTVLRRQLFSLAAGFPFFALGSEVQAPAKKLNIMMKSAWGSDDPTRASFVFSHGLVLAEAGHDVRIFLTGEATYLMRKATVDAIMPIGWPPLSETLQKVVAKRIPIFS